MLYIAQVFFKRHSHVICDTVIQLTSHRAQVIRNACLGELYSITQADALQLLSGALCKLDLFSVEGCFREILFSDWQLHIPDQGHDQKCADA